MLTLREFLTRNWFAKLFSIVLATLLWSTITREANSEIGIVVPLEYRNIPAQMEVTGDVTNTVEIRLRGSATLIRELTARNVSATVDLQGLPPSDKVVQLTSQNVTTPIGIEVVRVTPSQVRFSLEKTMSKTLPVVVRTEGEPADRFEVEQVTARPLSVELQGPESKILPMESVSTAAVDVSGRSSSFSERVDLELPDPLVRLLNPSGVEVQVSIRERGKNR